MSPQFWRNLPYIVAFSAILWVLFYFGARILQFLLVNLIGLTQ